MVADSFWFIKSLHSALGRKTILSNLKVIKRQLSSYTGSQGNPFFASKNKTTETNLQLNYDGLKTTTVANKVTHYFGTRPLKI